MNGEVAYIGYVSEDKRWRVTLQYQVTETEFRSVVHDIEELHELQNLIECGPTFCSIRKFEIEYLGPKETIEEARKS